MQRWSHNPHFMVWSNQITNIQDMQFLMGENNYKRKLSWTNVIRTFVTCLIEPSSKVWFSWSFWLKSIKSSIKLLEVLNQSLWSIKLKNLKSSIEVLNYLTSLRKVLKLFNSIFQIFWLRTLNSFIEDLIDFNQKLQLN